MSSLRWICALTLAMVCCLTAQPVNWNAENKGLISTLHAFTKTVEGAQCLDSKARYYTPADVHGNFLASALNCSLRELNVLYDECQPVSDEYKDMFEDTYTDLLTELKARHDSLGSSSSEQMFVCEKSPRKNFKDFLENFETLLQHMNSQPRK